MSKLFRNLISNSFVMLSFCYKTRIKLLKQFVHILDGAKQTNIRMM